MNWFRNRKTVTKLMIGFGVIAAMLAFVAYRGITAAGGVNTMLNTMYERDLKGLSSIKEANINLIYIGRAFRAAILAGDKAQGRALSRGYRQVHDRDEYPVGRDGKNTRLPTKAKRKAAEVKASLAEYYPQVAEIMRLAQAGDEKAARELMTKARAAADRADNAMTDVANVKQKLSERGLQGQ